MLARRLLLVAAFLLIASFSSLAIAAPVVQVDPSTKHLGLARHLDVFEDTTAQLDITDVTRPDVAARFTPFEGAVGPNYEYTSSALWARFTVENTSDVPLERWLVLDLPFVEHVEVFRDGEPPSLQGVLEPRDRRELPRLAYSFRLALAPHQTRVVHVRTWGFAEVLLPLQLWELGRLDEADRKLQSFVALSLGVMLAMALYNAFLFLFVRDRSHLYYSGYVIGSGLWCMCLDGSLLDLLPRSVQTLPHWVNILTFFPALGLGSLFVRSVLRLRKARPKLDRALLAGTVAALAVAVAYLLGLIDYRVQNVSGRVPILATVVVWILASLLRWRDGVTSAAYMLFGWVALVGMMTWSQLGLFGIGALPIPVASAYAVEAILLSMALAETTRLRAVQVEERGREVALLNEELRHQVAERSRELTEALARSEGSVAPVALETGDVFDGRYRIMRALGRGGMGAVYEVERARDGRKFALKVVTAALQAKQAARFAREAEIGARLQHENLVSIVDVGIAAGATPFLVMELVLGGSMEEQRSRFGDTKWALPILRHIASGLAQLHANSVVHRDLKPGNVLLVQGHGGSALPLAKISDFGISRFGALDDSADVNVEGATVSAGAQPASPRDLTEAGALMGTPVYMPPEAWFGPARHPSADVFSFGVLAYEALTGRSPFPVPPVLLVRSHQPIPTPAPIDGIDGKVAALVLACLEVEPSGRPRAKDLVLALTDALPGP
jgi:serine/threonine-protein kinase